MAPMAATPRTPQPGTTDRLVDEYVVLVERNCTTDVVLDHLAAGDPGHEIAFELCELASTGKQYELTLDEAAGLTAAVGRRLAARQQARAIAAELASTGQQLRSPVAVDRHVETGTSGPIFVVVIDHPGCAHSQHHHVDHADYVMIGALLSAYEQAGSVPARLMAEEAVAAATRSLLARIGGRAQ